ncbi:MAG: hypothetical protein ACK2UB_11535 [Anaerolineales bacterium]|jgi:hypothetical protein
MGFLQNILKAFTGGGRLSPFIIKVKCSRCGEILTARVNLANDLSVEYGASGTPQSYSCRKVLQGNGRCFQPVEVILTFDAQRVLQDREIHGGTFAEE